MSICLCLSSPTVQTIGINCAYCTESPPILYIYMIKRMIYMHVFILNFQSVGVFFIFFAVFFSVNTVLVIHTKEGTPSAKIGCIYIYIYMMMMMMMSAFNSFIQHNSAILLPRADSLRSHVILHE